MYLSQISQQGQQQQQYGVQQNGLYGEQSADGEMGLEVPQPGHLGSHGQSASISNGYPANGSVSGATTIGGLLAPGNPRGSHNRAVSLPAFAPGFENGGNSPNSIPGGPTAGEGERRGHQYQASFGGMGSGFGLAIQGGLNGWVEEEVAN